jgi:hypothetical protein
MSYTGIRLRLSIPAGPILDADSDHLYYIARFSGTAPGEWYEIIPGREMPFVGAGDLKVEIMAVTLTGALSDADDSGDGDESEDKPESDLDHCGCPCSNCSGCLG